MAIQIVHFSDSGPVRATNQDGYCLFSANTAAGQLSLLAVCDGMGGLSCGEVASATVIQAFAEWFMAGLPALLQSRGLSPQAVAADWNEILRSCHDRLKQQAAAQGQRWGTTLSLVLLTETDYYLLQVGDSRVYLADGQALRQLTKDQTWAMQELEAGRLSPDAYESDPRRNVLLQCIGDQSLSPVFQLGKKPAQGAVLLCSDGFYHTVSAQQLAAALSPANSRAEMQRQLLGLAARARQLGETDNLTVAALRWSGAAAAPKATLPLGQAAPPALDCLVKVVCANAQPI